MPEKIIRDPVHDVIAFRLERPIDLLLFQLLNAAEFQRLRRIRQLGIASLAYPGAQKITRPLGINNRGDIVGFWQHSANSQTHGFVLREWSKVQTDSLTICPVAVAAEAGASSPC